MQDLGVRLPSGFGIEAVGLGSNPCRVQGAGCRIHGSGLRVHGAGCRVQGLGCGVEVVGLGFGPCTKPASQLCPSCKQSRISGAWTCASLNSRLESNKEEE